MPSKSPLTKTATKTATKKSTAKKAPPAKRLSVGAVATTGSKLSTVAPSPTPAPTLPPTPGVPAPPAGFVPLDKTASVRLKKPAPAQVASAAAVASELSQSKTYAQDFSASAPAADTLASQLLASEAWTTEETSTATWAHYASAQKQLTWDTTLETAKKLQAEYDYAVAHDPTIPARYPELTRFLNAKHAQAVTSAAKRRTAKRKAKKAAAT